MSYYMIRIFSKRHFVKSVRETGTVCARNSFSIS